MRIGIGQYVIVRPLSTLIAVVSESLGWYCLASWSPGFVHLYTSIAITLSVTVAMYNVVSRTLLGSNRAVGMTIEGRGWLWLEPLTCTTDAPTDHSERSLQLQFYVAFKKELAPFSPVLKFFAVKVRCAPRGDPASPTNLQYT